MGSNKHVTGQHKWQTVRLQRPIAEVSRDMTTRKVVSAVIGLKNRFKNKSRLHLPTQTAASYKRCIIKLDDKNLCKNN